MRVELLVATDEKVSIRHYQEPFIANENGTEKAQKSVSDGSVIQRLFRLDKRAVGFSEKR